ncbi:hypothetical protein SYNTR_2279 [Candidatus Syntrophocurvum alkaliphilum]|uniref:Uncharacterized protein n=1 Tax=Candidatus Syntrophocurvum alkaliphilum TaxID=2293317 RepID=A0A6I6DIP6_9FIRM|nr:hypothetical protein [Candidatus Syntrophocurvum alkaliphilum]QGU00873.1 hypothetical protein SYNTR_2279 [Candidatus Syntrophocurvum alkaliphilum]
MQLIYIHTNNLFEVVRKYEKKQAHLVAITCPEYGKRYKLIYTLK